MPKLIFLALASALWLSTAAASPRPPPDYRVAEDAGLRYAEVISSRPAYRQVRVAEPLQECWTEAGRGQTATPVRSLLPMGASARSSLAATTPYSGSQPVALEEHCRTVTGYRYEQRIEGYDVMYRYKGEVYSTRMPYDPGSRVPVRIERHPRRH